jgi:polyhydroxyalkanoate synthesis regulator phasin
MINLLEKTMLTALGAATLSQKKAEELLQDLKQKFNVSEEEGKALLNKLRETAKENQEKLEQRAHDEVRKACDRLGVVTQDEFDKLKKKVVQLEKRIKEQSP